MKGRIMNIENGKFYLITENGEFTSADAAEGFQIGDEVEIKKSMPSYMKPLASVAAAVLIVCGGVWGYHIPVRYVDVCINPEIQLSLNVINRVVSVEAKNDDGEKIVSSQNLKNDSINKAIDEIVDSARSFGFMEKGDDGERDVIVSVYGDSAYKLSQKIPLKNVRVVDEADCEKAEAANIPVGKYVLINELTRVDSEQDKEVAKDLSVKEIIDRINDAKSSPKSTPTPPPLATPEPTPATTPTATPAVTEAPAETEQPTTVAKTSGTTKASPKVATVASKNKTTATKKSASSEKTSSGSSKSSTTTKTSESAKANTIKVSAKATAKPTSAPASVQVSASPSKAQTATPLPSFNVVKRPSANNTADKNKDDAPKNEQPTVNSAPSSNNQPADKNTEPNSGREQTSQKSENKENSKPTVSAPAEATKPTASAPIKETESKQQISQLQKSVNERPQTQANNAKAQSAPSGNRDSNGGENNPRPSGNAGASSPQQQPRPSGDNRGNGGPKQ